MQNRPPADPDVLPDSVTSRLLERASELDAAQRVGVTVADLRAAAAEAGISANAFDAALAELQVTEQRAVVAARTQPRRFRRMLATAASVIVALIVVGAIAVGRTTPAPGAAAPIVEKAFLLRCLSSEQGAALVRPLLDLPANRIVISPEKATRVVTIRGTPAQLEKVRAALDQYEGTGSAACARGPASER